MNNIYYLYFRYCFHRKLFSKTIWVIEHFLTMECYRKLCNRLYWRKIQPGTASYKTRCWIIFLSVLSSVWLAFFYDPIDPANLSSPSRILNLFSKIFEKIDHSVCNFFYVLAFPAAQYNYLKSYKRVNSDNILLWCTQDTYLKTSALLI